MPISTPASRDSRVHGSLLRIRLPGAEGTLNTSDSVLVGRDASCHLQLDDGGVSPRHAEVYRVGALWWVRDLGSPDGTYLDDECIDAAPVIERSTLRLGTGGPTLWIEPGGPVGVSSS